MQTGTAYLPLHGGKCPPWLFDHMKNMGSAIVQAIIEEFGVREVLYRLSDPVWFQALGCVLGFDWHSSGLTTTVCGALKEGLKPYQGDAGLFLAGGKGKTARNTPQEIIAAGDKYGLANDLYGLQDTSRLTAKIDSAAVQDGYQLYHHFFIFTASGDWAVIQQGMNEQKRYVRRYHWLKDAVKDYLHDPHTAVCCNKLNEKNALNMAAAESERSRSCSLIIANNALGEINKILTRWTDPDNTAPEQLSLFDKPDHQGHKRDLILSAYHPLPRASKIEKSLRQIQETKPEDYLTLLTQPGVGPATVRALALVAEIVYGTPASFQDPARFSFAHGGKDGHPFPVDRTAYTNSIQALRSCIRAARLGKTDKFKALERLSAWEKRQ